ncbi:MAG TPA: ScyD/ScyE family protein, partial [Thermoanaerobaculia bacterium]|nr:ScyD/ScyE family protein [Thermoanaerobaculia bacterium]
WPQGGPPFVSGLLLPSKLIFSPQGNLIVAESGTETPNTGRISIVDRTSGARRTLIDGLPSGIFAVGGEAAPSGPSGLAVQGTTLYATIGAGNGVLPGPAPGSEMANDAPSSPILSSLLSFRSSVALDAARGGFTLTAADQTTLDNGGEVTLENSEHETLTVRLVADFPNFTPNPRPDFAANVRASNPFGVVVRGQTLFVVDASQNLIRRVDANSGEFTTLTTFAVLPNTQPPIEPVPDSIHFRGDELLVTFLTGFPFLPDRAEVRTDDMNTGESAQVVSGLTSAIDLHPLGNGRGDALLVLEFSSDLRNGAPGRLRIVAPGGAPITLADGLPTPTSMAVDQRSGEVFITHIFPGIISRRQLGTSIPQAPPTAIIPVVASQRGAFNSRFRTVMQLSNPHAFPISGQLVVHPQSDIARPADPTLTYTIAPFSTQRFDDFMAAAGASGSGSVDVIASVGSAPVIVTTIVDENAPGSPAVQIPQLRPEDALGGGQRGGLITPSDIFRFRMNIGIRTLQHGAALTFRVFDSAGREVHSVSRPFPPMFFQQFLASDLLGGPLPANGVVIVTVDAGDAIVYAATIANDTGDATLQIASAIDD